MWKNKPPEELSVEELRRLLVEKRRKVRQEHLERFRRTGRVVTLASDLEAPATDHLHSQAEETPLNEPALPAWREQVKKIADRVLLGIEILAVAALILLLVNGLGVLRDLNAQFADSLKPPTLTPTPLIVAIVLPSGHTPPTSPGGARPNDAEIPEHLRPLVPSLAEIPIPTASPEQAVQIQIPAIGVDARVVQGDGWEQLKLGVAQHIPSANPGENGNLVLSGHNDVFGEVFRDLDRLQPGDQVVVYSNRRAYIYLVTGTQIVEPTQVDVMDPSSDATLTLISCYPYLVDNQRIIVKATLQDTNR